METVREKVIAILKKYTLNTAVWNNFTSQSRILADLKINSARIVDIILDAEKEFDITIEDELFEKMITVDDVVTLIYQRTSKK
ncbi:MAG: acyl carrier protein [Bacteroidetes bacterium ADurb.Bin408]|nr:MAG: acyl carrier protein [Bacteroidetes bacterium ADurb.Bin408]